MKAAAAIRKSAAALVGGVPTWLMLPGLRRRWSHRVDIAHAPAIDVMFTPYPRNMLLDVTLHQSLFLIKELSLPAKAKNNLDKVVNLHVRQSMPRGAADLLWRYVPHKRDKTSLTVDIFLLKKSVLHRIEQAAERHGVRIRRVDLAGHEAVAPLLDNRPRTDRVIRLWGLTAGALAMAMAGYVAVTEWLETAELSQRVANLEAMQADLGTRAFELRQTLDRENAAFADISRDVAIFEAEYRRLPILLDLTERLPDDTWISELSLVGSALRLSGFTAGDVAKLMDDLRTLPPVASVTLNGQVSFDSLSQRYRFDLALALAHSGATMK